MPWGWGGSEETPQVNALGLMPSNPMMLQSSYMQFIPIQIPQVANFQQETSVTVSPYDPWDEGLLQPFFALFANTSIQRRLAAL
jgi:hypothetical protein